MPAKSQKPKVTPAAAGCRDAASGSVDWISVHRGLPDDDNTVLIALNDGEVWTGFIDAGEWRYVSADKVDGFVTHWAEFPPPPNVEVSDVCPPLASETEKPRTGTRSLH